MNRVSRIVAVWVVAIVAAVSVNSQEVKKDNSNNQTQTTTANQQTTTTTPDYVFPTHRQRFDRYMKSTVGPFRLAWTTASAGP